MPPVNHPPAVSFNPPAITDDVAPTSPSAISNIHENYPNNSFHPRYDMLALILVMALRLSVCQSQVGILLKRLNEPSWFSARELLSIHPTLF